MSGKDVKPCLPKRNHETSATTNFGHSMRAVGVLLGAADPTGDTLVKGAEHT